MLLRRVFAYMIDSIITTITAAILIFMLKSILVKLLGINLFNASPSYYLLMLMVILSDIIINFSICIFNNGNTIGDDLQHIRITSTKFSGEKFYIIRFLLRTLSIYAVIIFLFVNILTMIKEKKCSIVWYDKLIGINCIII